MSCVPGFILTENFILSKPDDACEAENLVFDSLVTNCRVQTRRIGGCARCHYGYYLCGAGKPFCCTDGYTKDLTKSNYCTAIDTSMAAFSGCVQAVADRCQLCAAGYYFAAKDICCAQGKFWNTALATPQCSTHAYITNCLEFQSSTQCRVCAAGYYLTNFACCPQL